MPQQSNRLYISDLGISQKTNKQKPVWLKNAFRSIKKLINV